MKELFRSVLNKVAVLEVSNDHLVLRGTATGAVPKKELHEICEPARAALRRLPEFVGPLNDVESQLLKLLDKVLQDHTL